MLLEIPAVSVTHDEAKDCDQSVNDAEDFEEHLCRTDISHAGKECNHAGEQVNDVMSSVDMEDVEQHFIRRQGRNESEDTDQQKDDTE